MPNGKRSSTLSSAKHMLEIPVRREHTPPLSSVAALPLPRSSSARRRCVTRVPSSRRL
jgi:hypothetical protein